VALLVGCIALNVLVRRRYPAYSPPSAGRILLALMTSALIVGIPKLEPYLRRGLRAAGHAPEFVVGIDRGAVRLDTEYSVPWCR